MAEVKSLKSVLKSIQKDYGDNVVRFGAENLDVDGVLSLGSPMIDYCLYGGIPEGRIVEFSGAEGGGKAQPLNSLVFTPNGYIRMGDVDIGTEVVDGMGHVTKVTGVFKRGVLPIYKVKFNDGTSTLCAEDHLWKVYNHSYGQKPTVEVLETKELMNRKLHKSCWSYSIDVPVIDIWTDDNININPYLLGALIGDGSLSNNFGFSNSESDVVYKVNIALSQYGLHLRKHSENDYYIECTEHRKNKYFYYYTDDSGTIEFSSMYNLEQYLINLGYVNVHKFLNALANERDVSYFYNKYPELKETVSIIKNEDFYKRTNKEELWNMLDEYDLLCTSVNKHIPTNYLYSSYDTRVKLLQGLYDTDGYTTQDGKTYFYTSSEQLCKDVQFLARSLGCRVTATCESCPKYVYNNEVKIGNPSWTLYIKAPEGLVLGTSNKHSERLIYNKKNKTNWYRSITDIQYEGEEECQCIMVDSTDHTYLTNDLITTHNTSTAFLVAASYQREELKRHPVGSVWEERGIQHEGPRCIVFLDNEGTLDPIWAKVFGYDLREDADVPTILIRPEGQSAEQIFDMAIDCLKTGEVGLLIFDSIATLVPAQIADASMEQYQMGGIAKSLTRFANTAIGLLRKYKATLIGINQVRENMSAYGNPISTPGKLFCLA